MKKDLTCPIDFVTVNENRIRFIAMLVLLLAIAFSLTGYWPIFAFLTLDFALRAFNFSQFSLLAIVAGWLVKGLGIKNKPTDRGPKRFAASIGMVFSAAILIMFLTGGHVEALLMTFALMLFAFLESAVGLCVGCYLYTGLVRLRLIKR